MLLIKTKLACSKIHGIGLFAAEFISEGTVVWRSNPVIDIRLTADQIAGLPEGAREQICKYSYREHGSRLFVLCGDDARFFNHSPTPNCLDKCDGSGDVTFAAEDIATGHELTCDYRLFDVDLEEGRYVI